MKTKNTDLRNHLFNAIERLNSDDLKGDDLKTEIDRSHAIAEMGKVLVDSARVAIALAKIKEEYGINEEDAMKSIERPMAEYSNKSPLGIAEH